MDNTIESIAKNYHERDINASTSGGNNTCGCCKKTVLTVFSIEHDSQDYSKDLGICIDCLTSIHKIWEEKTPGKICPV